MKVSRAALKSLKDVGYTEDELAAAWNGAPVSMRDHRAQLLIWKAAQYDMAKAGVGRPEPKPLPAVQRPGIAPSAGERSDRRSERTAESELKKRAAMRRCASPPNCIKRNAERGG